MLGEIEVASLSSKYVVLNLDRIVGMCTIGQKLSTLLSKVCNNIRAMLNGGSGTLRQLRESNSSSRSGPTISATLLISYESELDTSQSYLSSATSQ